MIILGIDPGSRFTGFGFIKITESGPIYMRSGRIDATKARTLPEKIKILNDGVTGILSYYVPDMIIVETTFVNVNPRTSLILGQAKGAILSILVSAGCPIVEYSSLQVKKLILGYGRGTKIQLRERVQSLLGIEHLRLNYDESDALCLAFCVYLNEDFGSSS